MIRIFIFFTCILTISAQWPDDSAKYAEVLEENTQELDALIETHEDVELIIHPDRAQIYTNTYVYDRPETEDYIVGIIIDPCRANSPDCCVNFFGTPEFSMKRVRGLEPERVEVKPVLASEDEITQNYILVQEDGETIPNAYRRRADDDSYFNEECIALGDPYSYCLGKRYAQKPGSFEPACVDHNMSLNTLSGCYTIDGVYREKCMQVAYTQNAFIPLCGSEYADDDHCGVWLEIHIRDGTPYNDENEVISAVKVTSSQVSGYMTTTLNLTWMGDPSRVLCTYTEDFVRVGSLVYITPTSPICCCPASYSSQTKQGAFFCPIGSIGSGPYAGWLNSTKDLLQYDIDSASYPYCRSGLHEPDKVMCAYIDSKTKRAFTKPCSNVTEVPSNDGGSPTYTSDDLNGTDYFQPCPYFSNCGEARTACNAGDMRFTFTGRVGRVVGYDPAPTIPVAKVTFNDGRTSYEVEEDDLYLEYDKSMYEVWWVKRTRSEFVVEKKKGFNVTSPTCTFDTTNDRYFPWAQLDENGVPID